MNIYVLDTINFCALSWGYSVLTLICLYMESWVLYDIRRAVEIIAPTDKLSPTRRERLLYADIFYNYTIDMSVRLEERMRLISLYSKHSLSVFSTMRSSRHSTSWVCKHIHSSLLYIISLSMMIWFIVYMYILGEFYVRRLEYYRYGGSQWSDALYPLDEQKVEIFIHACTI